MQVTTYHNRALGQQMLVELHTNGQHHSLTAASYIRQIEFERHLADTSFPLDAAVTSLVKKRVALFQPFDDVMAISTRLNKWVVEEKGAMLPYLVGVMHNLTDNDPAAIGYAVERLNLIVCPDSSAAERLLAMPNRRAEVIVLPPFRMNDKAANRYGDEKDADTYVWAGSVITTGGYARFMSMSQQLPAGSKSVVLVRDRHARDKLTSAGSWQSVKLVTNLNDYLHEMRGGRILIDLSDNDGCISHVHDALAANMRVFAAKRPATERLLLEPFLLESRVILPMLDPEMGTAAHAKAAERILSYIEAGLGWLKSGQGPARATINEIRHLTGPEWARQLMNEIAARVAWKSD